MRMGTPFICRVLVEIGPRPGFLTGMLVALPANAPLPAPAATPSGDRLENGRVLAFASTDLAPGRLGATVVCPDGHKFAVTAMMRHGNTATPAVGIVQVCEERDGRPVSARCN
jgi:hypothetical protein